MRPNPRRLANGRRRVPFAAGKSSNSNTFKSGDVSALRASMKGRVVVDSTHNYDTLRQGFLHTFQSFPQMICYCEVEGDVQRTLEFAQNHGLTPVCRSGGHSTAGFSVNDELVIDLSKLSSVEVNEQDSTARVGAGTTFSTLDAELGPRGLHVPGGGCPSVAVAGYMQGGGYSFTSQMFGMNCDNVIQCRVATADGKIVLADKGNKDADLFWALRGGTGNNFGVLLEITYQLQKLDELWGFGFSWNLDTEADRDQAIKALLRWQSEYIPRAGPSDMGIELFIGQVPRETNKPPQPQLLIRGMHRGDEMSCQGDLQPLLDLCRDGGNRDIWCRAKYPKLNDHLMNYPTPLPDVAPTVRAVVESRIVAHPITPQGWGKLLDFYRKAVPGSIIIVIESYGGAINSVAPAETAFVHRKALMNIFVWSFWMYDEQRRQSEGYIQEFRQLMASLSGGAPHAYQNYPNRDTPEWLYPALYWGSNYPTLQEAKARYDPDNVFQFPHMVHLP
jgi:FAD/FMN-containing dehydrogenase